MRGVNRLVIALASALPAKGLPSEIVYIPEGDSLIYPKSHPNGIVVKMDADKGDAIAAAFQSDLERLAKGDITPRLDFKHEADGPISGYPTGFRYEAGRGLLCAVDWSSDGAAAIEGRNYAYFSPRFDLADDYSPAGLPEWGPLGALVNEPAFRKIERIAASDAGTNSTPTTHPMLILATCGLLSAAEAALPDAEKLAADRVVEMTLSDTEKAARIAELEAELAELKGEKEAAVAEASAAREERAKGMVEAAVADGRLAPKDDTTHEAYCSRIAAELASGETFVQTVLAGLVKQHDGLDQPIIEAGQARPETLVARIEAAQVKARTELGESATFSRVWDRASEIDPSAFAN
jgi:phage I-like protein